MRRDFLIALVITALLPGVAFGDIATANGRAKSGMFDATGEVRCAQEEGQALGPCNAEVARVDGAAVVIVRFPNGFARSLMFSDRAFLRGNATMSGSGTDMEWRLSGGLFYIRVDDQRFGIPETLVFGE